MVETLYKLIYCKGANFWGRMSKVSLRKASNVRQLLVAVDGRSVPFAMGVYVSRIFNLERIFERWPKCETRVANCAHRSRAGRESVAAFCSDPR